MADIVWEDPPRNAAGRPSQWEPFIEELQRHPGKWAIVSNRTNIASHASLRQRLKAKGCEAVQRKQPDGTYTLYARWPEDAS